MILVLLDGSLESLTTLAEAVNRFERKQVLVLSLNDGEELTARRLDFVREQAKHYKVKHRTLKIPFSRAVPPNTPFRQGIDLAVAAAYAASNDCNEVWVAAPGDEGLPALYDPVFLDGFSYAVERGTDNAVKVVALFPGVAYPHLVPIATLLEVPFVLAFDCEYPGTIHCGSCEMCVQKKSWFDDANQPDPTAYLDPITGAFPAEEEAA